MIDNINVKVSGTLYAGENNSNHLYIENLTQDANAEYWLNIKATDGSLYSVPVEEEINITESMIPKAGTLSVAVCEKKSEDDYVALSKIFSFQINNTIAGTSETPPPYESAKSIAEQAISYYESAQSGAIRGKSAYEVAIDEGFEGTEAEWLETLTGPQGDPAPAASIASAVADYLEENEIVVSGAMSETAVNLLLTILRAGVYTSDQSSNIGLLAAALTTDGSSDPGGDTPTDPGTDDPSDPGTDDPSDSGQVSITWKDGYAVNVHGEEYEATGFSVSQMIDISDANINTVTITNSSIYWASTMMYFYDANESFIKYEGAFTATDHATYNPSVSAQKPNNAVYVKMSVTGARKNDMTVTLE